MRWPVVLLVVVAAVLARLLSVLLQLRRRRARATGLPKMRGTLMAVLGSGGHTAEALEFLRQLAQCGVEFEHVVYVVARTDTHSLQKAVTTHKDILKGATYSCRILPRAREVGQSYTSSVFTTVHALLYSLVVVPFDMPDVLLINGPGTCVPIAFSAVLYNTMFVTRCRTIFVESVARVKTLSLSGILLYFVVDRFVVQWPQLTEQYPLAEYHGRLV